MTTPNNRHRGRKITKVGAISYAHLIKNMIPGDLTCEELAEETGLHLTTVYQYTREMYLVGAAHIARFEPDARGRHIIKIYRLGEGQDAKHVRVSPKVRSQRYRAKLQAQRMNHMLAGVAA